ncbi:MAG: hypothetical protein PHF60_03545 [Candidatus ainarchaeum sp.]|nr:hypothetical protein [Candidatus ainarchaeum sp.]
MDEEEAIPMPPQMDPTMAMRAMALSAVGDFMLFLGVIFVLLGVANFTTDFLKIKGSGEFSVGLALIAFALVLLMRSRLSIPKAAARRPAAHKPKEAKSDAYR